LIAIPDDELLSADLNPLTDAGVTGAVKAFQFEETDFICYYGTAENLEPSLSSMYGDESGMDCAATNGCGTHIHAGKDCTDSSTQMGHFYSGDVDPWAIVGYESTEANGFSKYFGCLGTGEVDYVGRAFIVHANDGSRVSCGLLDGPVPVTLPSVLDIVVGSEAHTTLEAAVLAAPAAIGDFLASTEGITLFAPDDDAFMMVPSEYLNILLTAPYNSHCAFQRELFSLRMLCLSKSVLLHGGL